jgi:hypothetical protein
MGVRAAPFLAGLALLAAGCGGGGGGNALPAAADVVPASAPVLISLKTDFSSEQWRRALTLARRFPGAGDLLREFRVQSGNVDFNKDVKPALGPEVDVVWLDFANGGNDVVGLTQPKNTRKFAALIAKLNSAPSGKTVSARVDGWTVVADERSKIDAFRRASSGDKLAGVGPFKDAMSHLDETAAVRAYIAGRPVQQQLDRALERSGAPANLTRGLARMDSISADALVERDGVHADAALATQPAAKPKAISPSLAGSLPSGALLYVSTANLADPVRTIERVVERSNPTFGTQRRQAETVLGFTLEKDVYPLISREQAAAVYPATPIPTIVFVAKVPDERRAKRLVDRLLSLLKLGGLSVTTFKVGSADVGDVTQPGSAVHGFVAVTRGKLIVTTARPTLATLIRASGRKLADDPLYREARAKAHVPGKVVAMVYGDLTHGLPFAFDLANANGDTVPPEARQNTRPLRDTLLYATQDGNRFRVSGFLTIK